MRRGDTNDKAARRAAWFQAFCAEAAARNDVWVTSIPNADTVTLETTSGSPWPAELRKRGFPLEADDPRDGERILGHGVREVVHVNRDGSLAPFVEGSTAPTREITHAGIIRVIRYRFNAP
jgi:hypothetical protein